MADIQTERNYGIDALRLIAMFLVVILHVLGQGGVLASTGGKEYYLCYFLETFSFCAVDCYAIISGYVGYKDNEKPLNYAKYGKMWIQVFFYSLVITLIFGMIQPGAVGKKEIIHSLFPVSFNQYWYFTEYTALFLMMPWINKLIRGLSERQTSVLAVIIICVFSVYTTFFQRDKTGFRLSGGYSFIWLALLYIIGCWLKKCRIPEKIKKKKALILLVFFVLIPFIYSVVSGFLPFVLDIYLIDYVSIFTLGTAIFLVILFSQIKAPKPLCNIIKFFSPAAFGVYLIHEHPYIKNHIITDKFLFIADASIWKIPLLVLGSALAIFILCLLIDRVRLFAFEKLKLNYIAVMICDKLLNWMFKLIKWLKRLVLT